jgi:hypothetical protein
MRSALSLTALASVVALGCGGDDSGVDPPGDAQAQDASPGDASDGDCYREQDDGGNAVTAEPTGLVRGVGAVAVCGTISIDHPSVGVLDVDRYQLAVATAGPATLRVSAPGAGTISRLEVVIEAAAGVVSRTRVLGGIGLTAVNLPIGAHTISITATGTTGSPVAYRITLVDDDPSARCPLLPVPLDYREADEAGAGHRANDVVAVELGPLVTAPTPMAGDAPEATGLAISAGGRALLAGLSADVAPAGDDYHDRDTFSIYTGQTTNLLELRAAWTGAADLDVLVFEADMASDPLGLPVSTVTGELAVTAVRPSTRYWIWIGGAKRSAALPADYTLALCGSELPVAP